MRGRVRAGVATLALVLLCAAGAARATPVIAVTMGGTLGVNGEPGKGGASTSVGLLWPVEDRFAFGASLFADDLGTGLSTLHDPNTGIALGTVADTHRWSFGGEWRGEVRLRETRRLRVSWGAGFGYGRQERDQRGDVRDAVSGVTASTGATLLVNASHGHAVGMTLAWKREFVHHASDPDRSTNWATAAFEWRWKGTPRE